MAADATQVQDSNDKSPPANQTADHDHLFHSSGFMDGLKSGWNKVQSKTAEVAHQGMEEGRKLANSPAGKHIQEKAVEAGHQGLEAGRKLANSPAGNQIQKEAKEAGHEVVEQHKKEGLGLVHGIKTGNINEVVRNGAPLAAEAAMGPAGVAKVIVEHKLAEKAMNHVPAQDQESARKAQSVIEKHGFPNLSLSGLEEAGRQAAKDKANQTVVDAADAHQ